MDIARTRYELAAAPAALRDGGPTVREPDGLAVGSRNMYLGEAERRRALGIRVIDDLELSER